MRDAEAQDDEITVDLVIFYDKLIELMNSLTDEISMEKLNLLLSQLKQNL
jgi:hypothetical protein